MEDFMSGNFFKELGRVTNPRAQRLLRGTAAKASTCERVLVFELGDSTPQVFHRRKQISSFKPFAPKPNNSLK